jgi:phosphatidylglycerol:prolipoprotein diacylglycerol transferase
MIPDIHSLPLDWGIRPVAFTMGGVAVSSYSLFVVIGLVSAIALYYVNTRDRDVGSDGLYIAAAAVVGGIIGSKLPIWVANYRAILDSPDGIGAALSGRTIVGGVLGGFLAVYLTKRRLGIKRRLGNYLVPSICLGIVFGRIGCYLAGCCYGTATGLPWGVDFGDGVPRNPTQLYEAALVLGFFVYAQLMKDRLAPGVLFKQFMICYFGWRFLAEFIRVNPTWAMGLTYYQVVAAAVVVAYLLRFVAGSVEGVRR